MRCRTFLCLAVVLLLAPADSARGQIASAADHAPHCGFEKEVEFDLAPFGILGLETELGLFIDILVHKRKAIDLARLVWERCGASRCLPASLVTKTMRVGFELALVGPSATSS